MRLLPGKVGAEPKKLAILGGLLVVFGVVYFMNRTPDSGGFGSVSARLPQAVKPAGAPRAAAPGGGAALTPAQRAALARRDANAVRDFKPSLKLPEGMDVSRIDPTPHLELITKLRATAFEGGARSLFDFGAAPAPTLPPKVNPINPASPSPASTTPAAAGNGGAPGPAASPAKPAAPPIPLKFYGYVNGSVGGVRQAFFLQGDEIFVAAENDVIQNRYKVIRIGVNSAVIEDTTNSDRQTIPLVQELAG